MPADIKAIAYAAYWMLAVKAGQQAYNAALPVLNAQIQGADPGSALYGQRECQPLLDANLYDMRTPNARAILRDMPTAAAGGGFPRLFLKITSCSEPQILTRTFAYAAGATCDVATAATVTLERIIVHDSNDVSDATQTPLECYIDAAERAARPKFNIRWMRDLTNVLTRREDEQAFGATRTVERRTLTFDLRPHRSDLA